MFPVNGGVKLIVVISLFINLGLLCQQSWEKEQSTCALNKALFVLNCFLCLTVSSDNKLVVVEVKASLRWPRMRHMAHDAWRNGDQCKINAFYTYLWPSGLVEGGLHSSSPRDSMFKWNLLSELGLLIASKCGINWHYVEIKCDAG